jgi:hypothetical protein
MLLSERPAQCQGQTDIAESIVMGRCVSWDLVMAFSNCYVVQVCVSSLDGICSWVLIVDLVVEATPV